MSIDSDGSKIPLKGLMKKRRTGFDLILNAIRLLAVFLNVKDSVFGLSSAPLNLTFVEGSNLTACSGSTNIF